MLSWFTISLSQPTSSHHRRGATHLVNPTYVYLYIYIYINTHVHDILLYVYIYIYVRVKYICIYSMRCIHIYIYIILYIYIHTDFDLRLYRFLIPLSAYPMRWGHIQGSCVPYDKSNGSWMFVMNSFNDQHLCAISIQKAYPEISHMLHIWKIYQQLPSKIAQMLVNIPAPWKEDGISLVVVVT